MNVIMKKFIVVFLIVFVFLLFVYVVNNIGQCVYLKIKVGFNGNFVFKYLIYVFDVLNVIVLKCVLIMFVVFIVKVEVFGGFVKFVIVLNYDLLNLDSVVGKVIGWVKLLDFDF